MSLGVVIKGTEGLVLAAESRLTLQVTPAGGTPLFVNFDNATKVLAFKEPHRYVGAVTWGAAAIGLRTVHSFLPELESGLPQTRLSVPDFAKELSDFFLAQWKHLMNPSYSGPPITLVVAGFDEGDPYGRIFEINVPYAPEPNERNPHPEFGITWGGQREFVDRILQGYDGRLPSIIDDTLGAGSPQSTQIQQKLQVLQMQVPLQAMALQDCVDFAIFMIRTTIAAQSLTVGIRGVGGAIDVATVTRNEGLEFVQKKAIKGETT